MGADRAVARRLPRLPPRARRAVGAPGAAQGARGRPATSGSARASWSWSREVVYRPGVDERVVPAIRAHEARDRPRAGSRGKGDGAPRNVKLGRGGIREIEFIVQALQLLYGGDDAWLRERDTLKAHLPPHRARLPGARRSGGTLSHALRASAHRRAPAADPPRAPDPHAAERAGGARASWRGALGIRRPAGRRRPDVPRPAPRDHRRRPPRVPRVLRASGTGRAATGRSCRAWSALGPPASPTPSAPARTCGSSSRGVRWCRTPARCGAALERLYPAPARRALEEPRSRRGAEPVRAIPVGGGAARGLRRDAGRQPAAARTAWCGSAPAAICSPSS